MKAEVSENWEPVSCIPSPESPANLTTTYLVDSVCTTSIICDTRYLRNYRRVPQSAVAGLSCSKSYTWKADLHLPTLTSTGNINNIVIPDCFWDLDGLYNLLATDQLNEAGFTVTFHADRKSSALTKSTPNAMHIPMTKVGRLHNLNMPTSLESEHYHAFLGAFNNLSMEELFHLRMAHIPLPKLAQMSSQVDGIWRNYFT